MKKTTAPNDASFILRLFHIPYIIEMFKLAFTDPLVIPNFPQPRFQLFSLIKEQNSTSNIKEKLTNSQQKFQTKPQRLVQKIIKKFKKDIIIGMAITFVWTVLNLLVPQIIREFFSLMKLQTLEQSHIQKATYITEKYILLQVLKAFMSGHITRCFYQLSLKIQSCLSAQITKKTLKICPQYRNQLPPSEVYRLQSIDLKMISKMLEHLWMVLQIPLTLIVAIFLLFRESWTFGIVGLYWLIITFFLQRWFSDKLIEHNIKKNLLIQERSKFNHQMIHNIKAARLDHSETLLLQKNNDYFLEQNKNHKQFYFYQSLFQISLILLPIIVAISITLYEHNQQVSITIKEVYILLTLLGICYKPLKNLQQLMLKVQDGLHSLKRIQIYLTLPQKSKFQVRNKPEQPPMLKINKNTMTCFRSSSKNKYGTKAGFFAKQQINVKKGQRLVILGRQGQGSSLFIRSLIGQIYPINGQILLQGSIAYLPEINFFRHKQIKQNISFYQKSASQEEIKSLYKILGLDKDLKFRKGLQQIIQIGKFSQTQLRKIGIARVLASKRQVIIMDSPFLGIGAQYVEKLQILLREKQEKGAMIIMTETYLRKTQKDDIILLISKGQIKQYGRYGQMLQNQHSAIHSFHQPHNLTLSDRISFLPIIRQFQLKIKKILILNVMVQERKKRQEETKILNKFLVNVGKYTIKLKNQYEIKKKAQKAQKNIKSHVNYFRFFISELPVSQWIFSVLIIISAQLLHIFIQYQIGKEYKKAGSASLLSMKTLINYELVLTICLAIIIYIQYQVLSLVSVIISNKVYQKSLKSLCNKDIRWFQKTHAPFIADKINHDYQEIYVMVKHIFDFFKYTVVLITTLACIDASYQIISVMTTVISLFYYFMFSFFRRAEDTLIRGYAAYKHDFAKVFDEIVEGGLLINLFGKTNQAFSEAKGGFINVSSVKQAINSTKLVQTLISQLTSCLIISLGFQYGTIIKIKQGEQNEALIAVSIMLLFNLSQVFKSMMQTIIKIQSFFRLKLISFIELIDFQNKKQLKQQVHSLIRYNIQFSQVIIQEKDDPVFQIYPLTLRISEGQKIVLYQQDNTLRNNLLSALTNNLQNFSIGKFNNDVIKIGNVNITNISKQLMKKYLAIILQENFYFQGTIEDNLKWKNHYYDQEDALKLSRIFFLEKEIPDFSTYGLHSYIKSTDRNSRQISRKLAIIKAILKKSKIIILKDSPWIIGGVKITQVIKQWKLNCTIIGITNDLAGIEGAQRLVYLQKLKIIEDDKVHILMKNQISMGGALLRSSSQNQEIVSGEDQVKVQQLMIAQFVNQNIIEEEKLQAMEFQLQ